MPAKPVSFSTGNRKHVGGEPYLKLSSTSGGCRRGGILQNSLVTRGASWGKEFATTRYTKAKKFELGKHV